MQTQYGFGYYLSDEPHIADRPGGPSALTSRASYLRTTSEGRQHWLRGWRTFLADM